MTANIAAVLSITQILLIMDFVRAERDAEWALHLWAISHMMPSFYAAGHVNYARYGLVYLRSMDKLEGVYLTDS